MSRHLKWPKTCFVSSLSVSLSVVPVCMSACFSMLPTTAFIVSDSHLVQPLALLWLPFILCTERRRQFLHLWQGFPLYVIVSCYILIAGQPNWGKMPLDYPRNRVTPYFERYLFFNLLISWHMISHRISSYMDCFSCKFTNAHLSDINCGMLEFSLYPLHVHICIFDVEIKIYSLGYSLLKWSM